MTPGPQPVDPRRERLRRQTLRRRQAVLDRISATRGLVIGGVVVATCSLAGYMEASAHTSSNASSSAGSSAISNSSDGGYNGSQGLFGGGSAPSASSGGGSVVSGGS